VGGADVSQSLTYDGVNRLSTVSDSGGWTRNFGYDRWGNAWVSGNTGIPLAGNTPTSNVFTNGKNQINNGTTYDGAGNQISVNGNTLTYDAEERQTAATEPPGMGGGTEYYYYDGAGQRVEKNGPSGLTVYVYDAFG